MAFSKGSRDNGEPGAEHTLSNSSYYCNSWGEGTVPLSPLLGSQFHRGGMRVEESSKARIQEMYKTVVGQEVAQGWGLNWAWHRRKLE